MAFSVYLLPEAAQDFDEAVAGYGGLQADSAIRYYSEVADAISALEDHPTHYGYYVENYRRILLETFPYRIVFRMEESRILVFAIFHTSRNDEDLYKRLS